MSRLVPSLNDRQSARLSHRFTPISFGFVWDEIAREEFDHAFRGAHERGYVKANVNSTRNQAFPPDLVPSQAKGKD